MTNETQTADAGEGCYYSWPDRNSVRTHVCIQSGDHTQHYCGVCGPSVTPPEADAA